MTEVSRSVSEGKSSAYDQNLLSATTTNYVTKKTGAKSHTHTHTCSRRQLTSTTFVVTFDVCWNNAGNIHNTI